MRCPVCGKSTKFFPLCEKCHDLKDAGKITRCIICGKWNDADDVLCTDCYERHKNKRMVEHR
jgi:RecJ-like exonuclease